MVTFLRFVIRHIQHRTQITLASNKIVITSDHVCHHAMLQAAGDCSDNYHIIAKRTSSGICICMVAFCCITTTSWIMVGLFSRWPPHRGDQQPCCDWSPRGGCSTEGSHPGNQNALPIIPMLSLVSLSCLTDSLSVTAD